MEIAWTSKKNDEDAHTESCWIDNPVPTECLHSQSSNVKQAYSLGSHCSFPHLKFLTPDRMLNQEDLLLLSLGFQTSSICINTSINKGANGRKEEDLLIKYICTRNCLRIGDCSRA